MEIEHTSLQAGLHIRTQNTVGLRFKKAKVQATNLKHATVTANSSHVLASAANRRGDGRFFCNGMDLQ